MQPAGAFYLGINSSFPSHQGHFGGGRFESPPYPFTTKSLDPYNSSFYYHYGHYQQYQHQHEQPGQPFHARFNPYEMHQQKAETPYLARPQPTRPSVGLNPSHPFPTSTNQKSKSVENSNKNHSLQEKFDIGCPSTQTDSNLNTDDLTFPSRSSTIPNQEFKSNSASSTNQGQALSIPTTHSAMSSREGTPISPHQISDEHPPNVDISKVQSDDQKRLTNLNIKIEQSDFNQAQMNECVPFNYMKSKTQTKFENCSFGENLYKQTASSPQQFVMSPLHHQMPPNHQFYQSSNNYASESNANTKQSRLFSHRPKTINNQHPRELHQSGNFSPNFSSNLNFNSGSSNQGSQRLANRILSVSTQIGSAVKIGRRPSHLPKVLKFQDVNLPLGWIRKLKCRKHGKQAGRWDVYIYSPCGVKFASRKKLKNFFEKNNLHYDSEDFDFTPYGRLSDNGSFSRGGNHSNSSNGNRHNSSSSTGSEATCTGSSPASIPNYSPTHFGASVAYNSQGITNGGFQGQSNYSTFNLLDSNMENHLNHNIIENCPVSGQSNDFTDLSSHRSIHNITIRAHHQNQYQNVKNESNNDGNFLNMSDFYEDSSTSLAIPDLGQGSCLLGQQVSDDDLLDAAIRSPKNHDLSDLGKAFNTVMNNEFA